jgi:5-dehydro-2-deoxygluconokinase
VKFSQARKLDIILAGRAGIDLNADRYNCTFAETPSFTKTVGGSPANIAQGTAKLGLKTGFIGKVSGDGMGAYILQVFKETGIDVSGVIQDQTGARNCLAITEILSPSNSGSYLYRENTADLLLAPGDIDENYVKQADAVLLSGTALSESPSREAILTLITYARRNDVRVIMDLDYRPYGWKSSEETAIYYTMAAENCDVIIGNREEFNALEKISMPKNRDDHRSAEALFSMGVQLVIIKDGVRGSCAYTPDGEVIKRGVIPTHIKKTFGSGDAYAAGLLYGLFRQWSLGDAMDLGSACASIVLAGDSCAGALPTLAEAEKHRSENPLTNFGERMDDDQ